MREPFAAIVGAERVSTEDAPPVGAAPLGAAKIDGVVRPRDAGELAACLGAAAECGVALVARGGGSKLHWGNPPAPASITLLDTSALDAIALHPDEGIATLGAGVPLAALALSAAERGTYTRLDPLYAGASVGGTIAADPVSPESGSDRLLRNDLLGLEVALPNGELTRSGGKVVKNVTGFDLVRLYCGSFGTLGVITEVTLRLRARMPEQRVCRLEFERLEPAIAAALELSRDLELAGLALRPDASGWELLFRLEGTAQAVRECAARGGGETVDGERWSSLRESIAAASEEGVQVRLGARPSDTVALCRELEQIGGSAALRCALPASGIAFGDIAADALGGLFERAVRERWSLFIERGAGDLDAFGPAPEALELMRALKARFDPAGVLAPGRFVGGI